MFLAFFEEKKKNKGNVVAIHEKNCRITSVARKQKMIFIVVERIR